MKTLVLAIILLSGGLAQAQQPTMTLRSTVTGNQEQPRVMYILPWQTPHPGSFDYQPGQRLADELFRPLDRAEFKRELRYYELSSGQDRMSEVLTQSTD